MKRLIYFFVIFTLAIPVNAGIITGEVEYNAENNYSQPKNNFKNLSEKYIDTKNAENLNYLFQGITDLKDRKLAKFSDGTYGVQYYDDPMYNWYYSADGRLINFSRKDSAGYPCHSVKYKPDGTVANTTYRVSESECFIYSPDGKLIAHWLGKNCYDKNNKIIMTRKIYQ